LAAVKQQLTVLDIVKPTVMKGGSNIREVRPDISEVTAASGKLFELAS
jgi:hypothetical protein